MIKIDGSLGEGGGQILRTALSLSMITGKPFQIEKIRANRSKPGLLRQHLTAVQAAVEVSGGEVLGAELGSTELTFTPNKIKSGKFKFSIGTAGSTTLVLQTVMPALWFGEDSSEVVIEGGTHNTMAPPFEFLEKTLYPALARMGVTGEIYLNGYGFYPAGGGSLKAIVHPVKNWKKLDALERGALLSKKAEILNSNLAKEIAEREFQELVSYGGFDGSEVSIRRVNAPGPGNLINVEVTHENIREVFTAHGERGVTSEAVARLAVRQMRDYLASGAFADEYLTDQLLLPMALAGGGVFTADAISKHTSTNMDTIAKFLPVGFETIRDGQRWKVIC